MDLLRNAPAVALVVVGHAVGCLGLAAEVAAAAKLEPSAVQLNGQSVALNDSHGSQTRNGSHKLLLVRNTVPELPISLAVFAETCRCEFAGLCTCAASVQLMTCIADACQQGTCDCTEFTFGDACQTMAGTCPSSGLRCTNDTAICLSNPNRTIGSVKEVMADLRELKEQKCRYEEATEDGWVNADNAREKLTQEIQADVDDLKAMGVTDIPSMNCSKPFLANGSNQEFSFAEGSTWARLPVTLSLLLAARSF